MTLNVKALVGTSRGLLRDCEIFANLRIAFVSSSIAHLHTAQDTELLPTPFCVLLW